MDRVIERIKGYFDTRYSGTLEPDDRLFEVGALDSMGVMELVAFLEQEFEIQVEPEDMVEENFVTLRAVADLVRGKSE